MVVYIEYAFFWNFFLDGILLRLSLLAVKRKTKWLNIVCAAFFGATFAIIFPLLSLPKFLSYLLKFAVGALLCAVAFGRIKNKKQWGRYALNCTFFFAFTFAFGGAAAGILGENTKKGLVLLVFAFLTVLSLLFIKKLYERRAVERYLYACAVVYKQKRVAISGFYDSGNLARHNGLPVCFLSPEIFYEFWGEEIAFGGEETAQARNGITFSTMSGKRSAATRLGRLEIEIKKGERVVKEVYFSPSANMVLREYKLLLNSRIFDE